jgi:hypothetical protein
VREGLQDSKLADGKISLAAGMSFLSTVTCDTTGYSRTVPRCLDCSMSKHACDIVVRRIPWNDGESRINGFQKLEALSRIFSMSIAGDFRKCLARAATN